MLADARPVPVAECFRHDGSMSDWERLGKYVVARRVELGYKQRSDFAAAVQISTRVLGDIENGRRGNFDPVTIASLESVLGWETGSALNIATGGEPVMRKSSQPAVASLDEQDEAVIRVMRSNIPDEQKRAIMRILIDERREAERQRLRRAEDFIRLVGGDNS